MTMPPLGAELLALAKDYGGTGNPVRWEELTWPEARAAANPLRAAIIPIGAIEQHGFDIQGLAVPAVDR